jgi:hypothetical protein
MRRASLIPALFLIVGCAGITGPTEAEKEATKLTAETNDVFRAFASCLKQIEAKPKYVRLYEKFAVGLYLPTANQLADSEVVTDALIPLGFDWYAEAQDCNKAAMESFYRIDPEFGAVAAGWYREVTRIMLDAVTTKPTYGKVNSDIKSYMQRRVSDVNRTAAMVRSKLTAKHQTELHQRAKDNAERTELFKAIGEAFALGVIALSHQQAAMAQAQREYVVRQPIYVPERTIRTTTCHTIGYGVQCDHR